MVGVAGLEPTVSYSQSKRDTRLHYTPKLGSAGWIRTSDLDVNSILRYHCATAEYMAETAGFEPVSKSVTGTRANR